MIFSDRQKSIRLSNSSLLERFFDIIPRPASEGLHGNVLVSKCGYDDGGNTGLYFFYFLQDLDTRYVRQLDVQECEIYIGITPSNN